MTVEEIVQDPGKTCVGCRWLLARADRDIAMPRCNCFHSPYYGSLDEDEGAQGGCHMRWPGPPWMEWVMDHYPSGKPLFQLRVRPEHCKTACRHYDHVAAACRTPVSICRWAFTLFISVNRIAEGGRDDN